MPVRRPVPEPSTPALDRPAALAAARRLAVEQEGVVSRRQLAAAGVPRWVSRLEVRSGRWQRTGRQTLVLHNGTLLPATKRWRAVLEIGARVALDGVSALQHAGIDALEDEVVHVIAPKGSTPSRAAGVVVHESRLFRESDVVGAGLRRTAPAVAAVHAALWATTDRQAAYFLLLVVQQRRARATDVAEAVAAVRRHRRRLLLRAVARDLVGGVEALSELDVAADMRRRGLPEPDRQVVRCRPSGTQYLDCELAAYDVVLEIDGAGHDEPQQRLDDVVRDITLLSEGRSVVRLPIATYALDRERVLDALEALLVSRGWQRAAA